MKNPKERLQKVCVIGATPAGIAATNKLGEMGIQVTLIDSAPDLNEKLASDIWRMPSGVSFNYAQRPGLLRIMRNPRIRILLPASISSIKHTPQGFSLRYKKTAAYVDSDKCTLCGLCWQNCPAIRPDGTRALRYGGRHALPGRPIIDKRRTPLCQANCPLGVNVQGYIALAQAGKYAEALELIRKDNFLPAICGRICTNPCEAACRRNELDQPVAIRDIKRFLADLALSSEIRSVPRIKARRDQKIAIIGSGPAGLSCAYHLAIEGYRVKVFEKLPVLGGMLTVGIPSYRLPKNIIEAEIQVMRDMGVEFETGVEIGKDFTISQLRSMGYKAFFIGIGAHKCKALGVPGEELEGVVPGVEYLRDVNLGRKVFLGDRVAVIGGGSVAVDTARTALRNGSRKPVIVYRRSEKEMPAIEEEIIECREEGIEIMTLTNPRRIIGENGRLKAVECLRMELGEPDSSGRRRPVPIAGSEFIMEVDAVVPAIGQESEWACLAEECNCRLTDLGTMTVDRLTAQTNEPDIFAGGDAVSGPSTVVSAMASGRSAAFAIHGFLTGEVVEHSSLSRPQELDFPQITPGTLSVPRARKSGHVPASSNEFSVEVSLGLTEDQVQSEASRCLQCGVCSECRQCVDACSVAKAISHSDDSFEGVEYAGVVIIADPAAAPGVKGEDVIRAYSSKTINPEVFAMMSRGFAAAAEATLLLGDSAPHMKGHGLSFSPPGPQLSPELRIGVFACRCNESLGWDPEFEKFISRLPENSGVEFAESVGSACTPEGAASILRTIREKGLTRFVLASCVCCPLDLICSACTDQRSRLKAAIFQGTGVTRAMAETCNLRGEALSLLKNDQATAVSRFKGLIQRSIRRCTHLKSLPAPARQYNFTTAVIGESNAVLRSAQTLGQMGMEVFVFGSPERPLPSVPDYPNVHGFLGSCAKSLKGTVGDFQVIVAMEDGASQAFSVGAVILGESARRTIAYMPHPDMPPHEFSYLMQTKGQSGIPFFVPGATSIPGLLLASPPSVNLSERLKGTAAAILAATVMPRGPRQNKGYTVSIDESLCRGCGRCVNACPYRAISFHTNSLGSGYAVVDEALCKGCGNCISICPSDAADSPYRDRLLLEQIIEEVVARGS
ncbi:MAG: FAD-dependent oxidoreductase [Syntrophobacteraceae bacterium]|jgi:NADPH-dependent glutamate synthase beta subunit-like oxidoreductase/NAD-dependent dihydropyrimidine dehydrogenase PreA subunit